MQQSESTAEYFLGDALGSVRQLTSQNGQVTFAQSYDPYGVVTHSSGESQTDFAFTGEQLDASGLTYLRARYYNPLDGRFISRDTWEGDINTPASLNRFAYAHNNPVMNTDPSGHCLFTGVDTIACALLTAGVLGFLVGADIGGLFGLITYDWALANECGCEMRDAALKAGNKGWFALQLALGGGLIGGVAGAAAVLAPAAMIFIGGAGAVVSYLDIQHVVNQIERLETGGRTWCTAMRLILDVVGIAFGAYGVFKGVQAWAASGKILRWANGVSPYLTRAEVIAKLNQVAGKELPGLVSIAGDEAAIGFRGSLARGTVGNPEKPTYGNPVDLKNFDIDAFIISDQLAAQFPSNINFRSGNRIGSLASIQTRIDTMLRSLPEFAGLRANEPFEFRIWTWKEAAAKFDGHEIFWYGGFK